MPSRIQFSQEFVSYRHKRRRSYPIPEDDWEHLKERVSQIEQPNRVFRTAGSALLAVGGSGGLTLLAFTTAQNVPSATWIAAWVAFLCGVLVGLGALYVDSRQGESIRVSADDVLNEMKRIEDRFEEPRGRDRERRLVIPSEPTGYMPAPEGDVEGD